MSVATRLNKGEYVVKEATMAKLKSTKVADEAIYELSSNVRRLWLYGRLSIGTFIKR